MRVCVCVFIASKNSNTIHFSLGDEGVPLFICVSAICECECVLCGRVRCVRVYVRVCVRVCVCVYFFALED